MRRIFARRQRQTPTVAVEPPPPSAHEQALALYQALYAVPGPRAVTAAEDDGAAVCCLATYCACRRYLGHTLHACVPPDADTARRICAEAVALQEDLMRRTRALSTDRAAYEAQFADMVRLAAAAFVMVYERVARHH